MNIDLTKGPVLRTLAKFCWPLVLANLLQTMYSITDMIMSGRFIGETAMSAVSAGGQLSYLLTTLSMGLAAGGQILISQQKGADKDTQKSVGSLLVFSSSSGILLSVTGFFLARTVLNLINTPPEAFDQAVLYMKITSWGMFFVFCQSSVSGLFRGLGCSSIPLYISAASTALNLALDYVFLKLLKLGISGISLATVLSQGLSFLLALVLLYKSRERLAFDFRVKLLQPDWGITRDILKIGLPFAAQLAIVSISNMYITSGVNSYGVTASAALGAGVRITNLLTVPMMAAGNGASTMVGQSMGANDHDRAAKAVKIALFFMLCISAATVALCQFLPETLVGIFKSGDGIVESGAEYLRTVSWCFFGHCCHSAYNAAALGVGFSTYSLFSSSSEALLGRVLLTFFLGNLLGLNGIFVAQAISPYISGAISGAYYYSGKWKKHKLLSNR